jgi:hypothetical protein
MFVFESRHPAITDILRGKKAIACAGFLVDVNASMVQEFYVRRD